MPAKKDQPEVNLEKELVTARRSIGQTIAGLGAGALGVGMGGVVASAIWGLASANGINDAALTTLLGSLSANWISSAVWELRERLRAREAPNMPAEVARLAQEWQPQLTDARLGDILQKLGALDETLKALDKHPDQTKPITEELLSLGLATKTDLEQALTRVNAGSTVRARAENVINSVFIAAGGDVNIAAPITIYADNQRVLLDKAIDAHRREIYKNLRDLDLDPFDVTLADNQNEPLELADIYIPLFANSVTNSKKPRFVEMEDSPEKPGVFAGDEQTRAILGEDKKRAQPSIIGLLNDHPRMVMLGDPGSGKSTVLNYLALGLCGKTRDKRFAAEWHHHRLIPLRAELRNFAQWAGKRQDEPYILLLDYLREKTIPKSAKLLADHLEQTLSEVGGAFLLDGLDEVPSVKRQMVKKAVDGLMERYPRCRFVITCRTYSYQDARQKFAPPHCSISETTIRDLDDEQIAEFVSKWYAQLSSKRGKPNLGSDLIAQLRDKNNPRLRRLASTPLMLTLITSLHSTEKSQLPNERHKLMEKAVDLLLERWERVNKHLDADSEERAAEERVQRALRSKGKDALMAALHQVAFEAHRLATSAQIENEEATADIPESMLRRALEGVLKDEGITKDDLTDYLRNRAGLLINKGDDPNAKEDALSKKEPVYRFPHRMFQEYMAAMLYKAKPKIVADLLKEDFNRWREVYALMALSNDELGTLSCVNRICPAGKTPSSDSDKEWQFAILSANIWADKKLAGELDDLIADSISHVRKLMTDLMFLPYVLTPTQRAEAGRKLCLLPNPDPARFTCADWRHAACANLRTREGLDEYLQNGFVRVEVKPFTMQAGEKNAAPAPVFPNFRMAKTPVTVAQFAAFVDDGAYEKDEIWNWSPEAQNWRSQSDSKAPRYWGDTRFHHPNSPVVGVTWYEAMAFCRWLTLKIRACAPTPNPSAQDYLRWEEGHIDLPTELEWEFAARGTEARDYAWKKGAWQKGDELFCNISETGINATSAVGMFPNGATSKPEVIFDMTGNVWEWMRNEWDDDWKKAIQKKAVGGNLPRSLRGGSWSGNPAYARCANRLGGYPGYDYFVQGFRVVLRA